MTSAFAVGSCCVAAAALVLRRRRRARRRLLASAPARDDSLERLLEELIVVGGHDGRLVQVMPGDTIDVLAEEALARYRQPTQAELLEYIHCITAGKYNLDQYGTPSTSKIFPDVFRLPGVALGLRVAFLPRNADAQQLLAHGIMPPKTVNAKGVRLTPEATHFGLPWFPPIDREGYIAGGSPTCRSTAWEDGSSSIDPPFRLRRLLRRMQ